MSTVLYRGRDGEPVDRSPKGKKWEVRGAKFLTLRQSEKEVAGSPSLPRRELVNI